MLALGKRCEEMGVKPSMGTVELDGRTDQDDGQQTGGSDLAGISGAQRSPGSACRWLSPLGKTKKSQPDKGWE